MANLKILLLYPNCMNETGPTGKDKKAYDCVKFIKKKLPGASGVRIDFCDPGLDASAQGTIPENADRLLDENENCILILSNETTRFFDHLKAINLWDVIHDENKKLVVVFVERDPKKEIIKLFRARCNVYLIGYDANSQIREEDDQWDRLVNTIKNSFEELCQRNRDMEEGPRLPPSAPTDSPSSVEAEDEQGSDVPPNPPDGHQAQNGEKQGSGVPSNPPGGRPAHNALEEQEPGVPPNPPDGHPDHNALEEQEPDVPPNPPDGHPAQKAQEEQESGVPLNPPDGHPAQNGEKQEPEVPPNPPDGHPSQNAREKQGYGVPPNPPDGHPDQNTVNHYWRWGTIGSAVGAVAVGAFFFFKKN